MLDPPLIVVVVEVVVVVVVDRRAVVWRQRRTYGNTRWCSGTTLDTRVTLSDGTVKEGKKWETTPFDIAKELSKSLASNALISQVNGLLWDMSRPLESDCQLKIFTFDSNEGRDTFWHSSAHILGQALEQTYGCKLCIGPCTTRGEVAFIRDQVNSSLNDVHFDAFSAGLMEGNKTERV
ncbi:threonine--tRNA ligase, mitochondrial 1-like protein [Tanacetum coccineum]